MNVSHFPVAGSYLIMSPGPAARILKFEKKNAFCAGTHVGPSFQSYLKAKSPQIALLAPGLGASNGPAGQKDFGPEGPVSGAGSSVSAGARSSVSISTPPPLS